LLAVHSGLSLVENNEFDGPLDLDEAIANFSGGQELIQYGARSPPD
jgi:hypothetical protein